MLRSNKNVFWEALVLTIAIFLIGIFIGIAYEGNKVDEINNYYASSEISLMDAFALSNINVQDLDCNTLIDSHVNFADRIYDEAFLLEKYEESGKLSESLKIAHRRYDLLRTLLWINTDETLSKCGDDFSIVVYLYEYDTNNLAQKAEQKVWGRILFDLKQDQGNQIILIPIAVDSNLISLDAMLSKFDIPRYPVIIINNKQIISNLDSVKDLEKYL